LFTPDQAVISIFYRPAGITKIEVLSTSNLKGTKVDIKNQHYTLKSSHKQEFVHAEQMENLFFS